MNKPDEVRKIATELAEGVGLGGIETEHNSLLLLGGAAINLALIAEAVAKLVDKNPDPTKPVSLRDLSPDECKTIEALRSGDFVVVSKARAAGLT